MNIRSVLILFITLFVVMVGFGIVFPILPFYSINLGATPFQIGMLMASYSLMQFIFSPMWGVLSDKYGRRPIILIGLSGFTITFILFGLANSLLTLFISRMLGGFLSSACLPTAMAYIADTTSEEDRGQGMGLMGAAMGLGVIVGPAIGGLFSAWNMSTPFFIAAAVAGVNFIFAWLFLKESKKEHAKTELKYNRFRHLLSLRGYLALIFFLVFLFSYSMSSFESTFSLFAQARLNYKAYDMGIVFSFMGLASVIVQGLLVGRMIKKMGEGLVIKVGLAFSVIGYGFTMFAFNPYSLLFFVILAVIGQGVMRPALASIISKDTKYEEGATMGAMQSVDSLGRIMGPLAGGFLFQIGMTIPYMTIGGINLFALLGALLIL